MDLHSVPLAMLEEHLDSSSTGLHAADSRQVSRI